MSWISDGGIKREARHYLDVVSKYPGAASIILPCQLRSVATHVPTSVIIKRSKLHE
jgi:hypothetical protein